MKPSTGVLQKLASLYEAKRAARTGRATRDVFFDYEQLLKDADCVEGERRELAERELCRAADEGLVELIPVHRRDPGHIGRIRFRPENERALFDALHLEPPSRRREALAAQFEQAGARPPVRWRNEWITWCETLRHAALIGESVRPFDRSANQDNEELLALLRQLLDWTGESLMRFASSRLCGDSKRLEQWRGRIEACLSLITEGRLNTLTDLGITENERAIIVHGPLWLLFTEGLLDLGFLSAPARIDRRDILRCTMKTTASSCLLVENLSVLHELAKRREPILLVSSGNEGGYAHSALIDFLKRLPANVRLYHCGDTDPQGFDILRNLRERSGREIHSYGMEFDGSKQGPSLSRLESDILERLIASDFVTEPEKKTLCLMREAGHKGRFEQEARPLSLPNWQSEIPAAGCAHEHGGRNRIGH